MKPNGRRGKPAPKVRCGCCQQWCVRQPLLPAPPTRDDPEPFCEALKIVIARRLIASGKPDYELAQLIHLHRDTIGDMRRCGHNPAPVSLARLARYWQCNVIDLIAEAHHLCLRLARRKTSDSSD